MGLAVVGAAVVAVVAVEVEVVGAEVVEVEEVVRRRRVVTYGLPHQATSAVDTPDVTSAVVARAARAVDGRDDSTMNMNGERELASTREESEKILSRRKVDVRGPTYMTDDGSSLSLLLSSRPRPSLGLRVASATATVDRYAAKLEGDGEGEMARTRSGVSLWWWCWWWTWE